MADIKTLLAQFDDISRNPQRLLKEYVDSGEKVIACFPIYTPEPLVAAAGMVPMGIWGGQCNPQAAGKYAPIFTCSIMRSVLEFGMTGAYKGVSAAIMPIICDTLRGTNSAWRAGVKDIEPITFIYPQNRKDPGAVDFLIEELKTVKNALERISGREITDTSLQQAIALYNKKHAVMRAFCETANEHLDIIKPADRHHVMKAVTFLKAEKAIEMVVALTEALKAEPICKWQGKKVLLTGITCEPDEILGYFADNGIAVVGDDLAQESRQYRSDYPAACSAMESLALHWFAIKGCSVAHDDNNTARGDMLAQMAKDLGADCVVLCMMRFCEIEEYDQPSVITQVSKAGLMSFSIDIDQSTSESGQALTKIQAYAEN
ncbi:MAG: 2-hydroxyacyl-CoA dehydratase subunit D [Agathobaculum sp.]|jgi:benzoyl-CoA reductase/2-hydroxyglutaryl-CoA dehydratase subunit BcrC/BadD/HgdB|uniref:2-hydroxyacyl-CoA dehydratase subunit D n=1 Tax=Agathobaculum sp. TaxID=2048138 RepID=UPI003D8E22F8